MKRLKDWFHNACIKIYAWSIWIDWRIHCWSNEDVEVRNKSED